MKAALVSLDQKWEDKGHNLSRVGDIVGRAKALGADVVIFPEMTLTGFTMNTSLSAEDPSASPSREAFRDLARQHGLAVIAGVVMRNGARAFNTLVAFSPADGTEVEYAKIHPFSFSGEDKYFDRGASLATIRIGDLRVGLTICYDLRFPELYTALARDCEVLVNIANWPRRRAAHWNVLLRARAIENQVYMVGVNRTGTDGNGLEYERSSGVIDANGEALRPLATEGEIDLFELTAAALRDFRSAFSTRHDRVPETYRSLI